MNAAAIAGSYADFKVIKTRSVVAISIEIPIEQADDFISTFGVPVPGNEKQVALALLNKAPEQPEKGPKRWDELSRAQQAGILCADIRFQDWCGRQSPNGAATYIRERCRVFSRADIDKKPASADEFDRIVMEYRQASGQFAEARR